MITNRSIVNETSRIYSGNNTDFLKNLEDEILNRYELENNLNNLSKEKSTFLNLLQNHQEKFQEKIFSLSKIRNNYEGLRDNLDEDNIMYL